MMNSHCKFALLLGGSLCSALSFVKADVIPGGFAVDRYSSLWEHSPFTVSSIQQLVIPPGFADKLALVGIIKIGSENMVTLFNKDSLERISVSTNSSPEGMKIVSVELDKDPQKDSVTIQKGDEIAKVKFDKIPAGSGQVAQTAGNPPLAPVSPGVARPITAPPVRVAVTGRVARIVSPAPYSGQPGGQQLPPLPGSVH
jgi:hypothetical protein